MQQSAPTSKAATDAMTAALSETKDQPGVTFRALETVAQAVLGVRLFTIMELDRERGFARRSYSNMDDAYPVSGEKPIEPNGWLDQIERQEMFVANSIDDIAHVFGDHALIQSLGCESCINIPIHIFGQVRGTINCLNTAGYFTPARLQAAQALIAPGKAAFLLSHFLRHEPSVTASNLSS
ncbi:GAF domain-containing protein [Alphaproteobacteria bacterium]|jgi:GAF domain-containing protein|nr:GAF domain-containing protein [Alphaproteobacteria bacterium]